MPHTIRELDPFHQKAANMAAAMAKEQFSYAKQIVQEGNPENPNDEELVAAVLQAIATNYLAFITNGKG
ncbi:hypothetical protein [Acidovorax sp. Root217]|uniref:hypothetical protein n=1 Tax=Acidovorax sp. Root217 TaxID=1736492 RepID=UPI00071105DC|nr:hypothetical protein [Acidovorax sp. Root217]KRC30674.1 hypothetical protein ASE31_00365 [Acidovorax sp. Root217]